MEALVARKWLELVIGHEREGERHFCIMRKKGAIRILAFSFNISVKFSLITFTFGFSIGNTQTENFLARIVLFNPSVKKFLKKLINIYFI